MTRSNSAITLVLNSRTMQIGSCETMSCTLTAQMPRSCTPGLSQATFESSILEARFIGLNWDGVFAWRVGRQLNQIFLRVKNVFVEKRNFFNRCCCYYTLQVVPFFKNKTNWCGFFLLEGRYIPPHLRNREPSKQGMYMSINVVALLNINMQPRITASIQSCLNSHLYSKTCISGFQHFTPLFIV